MLLQINLHYKSSGAYNCPFCREPILDGEEENRKRVMERVKTNDPAVMHQMGIIRFNEGDIDKAVEYLKEAGELGDAAAHYQLGCMYYIGEVVEKDLEMGIYHWKEAAIGGHPQARHYLAIIEGNNGNTERAVKNFIIAASLGYRNQ